VSTRDTSDLKRRAYAAMLAELRSTPTRYAWARALRMRRELLAAVPSEREPAPVPPLPRG
jgi:hypothetical protein